MPFTLYGQTGTLATYVPIAHQGRFGYASHFEQLRDLVSDLRRIFRRIARPYEFGAFA